MKPQRPTAASICRSSMRGCAAGRPYELPQLYDDVVAIPLATEVEDEGPRLTAGINRSLRICSCCWFRPRPPLPDRRTGGAEGGYAEKIALKEPRPSRSEP